MQKPGELKKPLQPGSLRKDRPCPGCGMPFGDHAQGCTWAFAAAQLQPHGAKKPAGS